MAAASKRNTSQLFPAKSWRLFCQNLYIYIYILYIYIYIYIKI